MMTIVVAAVALTCFILYALDRKSKQEPIDMFTGGKVSLFGGILSAIIVFATTAELPEVSEVVKDVLPVAQDMFVGNPTF
jgi:uncharacterized membrane protein YdcZ (DUF606 family)